MRAGSSPRSPPAGLSTPLLRHDVGSGSIPPGGSGTSWHRPKRACPAHPRPHPTRTATRRRAPTDTHSPHTLTLARAPSCCPRTVTPPPSAITSPRIGADGDPRVGLPRRERDREGGLGLGPPPAAAPHRGPAAGKAALPVSSPRTSWKRRGVGALTLSAPGPTERPHSSHLHRKKEITPLFFF